MSRLRLTLTLWRSLESMIHILGAKVVRSSVSRLVTRTIHYGQKPLRPLKHAFDIERATFASPYDVPLDLSYSWPLA